MFPPMKFDRFSPPRMNNKLRRALIVVSSLVLVACGDSPMAPEPPIDVVAAARLMPSVTDARIRLAMGIDNASVRERVVHDLRELEIALANGDGRSSRFHVRVIGSIVDEYRIQEVGRRNAPDLTAISLVLYIVSQLVGAGYEIGSVS
jgi:hypothetical protein